MYTYMKEEADHLAENERKMGTNWVSDAGVDSLNSEAAAALRTVVSPIFQAATDWRELQKLLARKGFGLTFRKGHMVLTDIATGVAICTGKFLGTPLKEMSARLGRPSIVALPGGMTGDFMH